MVVNTLFSQKQMDDFIKKYDEFLVISKPDENPIDDWLNRLNSDSLKDEVSNYSNFQTIILDRLLGYDINDIKQETSIGSTGHPVDFVLLKNNVEYVALELKSTKTKDLDKRVRNNVSPVEQVTNYASVKEETKWAFISNYDEFRLFDPSHRKDYISFKFSELRNPKVLKEFLLIFSKFSLIDYDIVTKLLNDKPISINLQFEQEFYKLYSETRLMLIKQLNEPDDESIEPYNLSDAIYYAQLILNRYIFICFAEDKGLIPDETSTKQLFEPLKENKVYNRSDCILWENLTYLFRYVDEGNAFKNIPNFNGGLFKQNLRNLRIKDSIKDPVNYFKECFTGWEFKENKDKVNELLGKYQFCLNPTFINLLIISSFDFDSELDVNILGHIFENSIGDIEQLKDQTKVRRKKDGIFYTPENITNHICKNTIIPYLSKSGEVNTIGELIEEYNGQLDDLDIKLKNIKILDLACGSGAFLNKATDILLEIHESIYNIKYGNDETLDKWFDGIEVRKEILIDNIHGVDLNEESIEITKLAMFLKIAKKNSKLPNLDKNIKCGNSLIDDKKIVGCKSFDWNKEFKTIMDGGGFDIVISNPPYVRQEEIDVCEKTFLSENYKSCSKSTDLYVGFFERGINLLRDGGLFSVICSNKYITVDYAKNLRKFLLNFRILQYNDFPDVKIFDDAEVDASTIFIKKEKYNDNLINVNHSFNVPQMLLDEKMWYLSKPEVILLKNYLLNKGTPLSDIESIEINNGIKTGFNEAFYINNDIKNELIQEDALNKEIIKPLLLGKDINQWCFSFEDRYIIFARQGIDIDRYPSIKQYLSQYKMNLTPKSSKKSNVGRKMGSYQWYEIQDKTEFYENFEKPKLIWAEMNKEISFCYDDEGYYVNNKCFIITSETIELKFLLALFLSDLFKFLFKSMTSKLGKSLELRKSYVKQSPIIFDSNYKNDICLKASSILRIRKQIENEKQDFLDWIMRNYFLINLPQKMINYHMLSFDDFFKLLKQNHDSSKINLRSRHLQYELKNEFESSVNKILLFEHDVDILMNEINQLVYKMYDLTDKQIKLIESEIL